MDDVEGVVDQVQTGFGPPIDVLLLPVLGTRAREISARRGGEYAVDLEMPDEILGQMEDIVAQLDVYLYDGVSSLPIRAAPLSRVVKQRQYCSSLHWLPERLSCASLSPF
jgi:hypothetical protein